MSKFKNSVKAFPGRSIIYCPSTRLFKYHRKCLIAFGDRRHHVACDLHVRTPAAQCSVWPPTLAEIAICIPRAWKMEIYLSDSVSARLCSAGPRRHPIPRFRPVPGGCTCTQSRATCAQEIHSFRPDEPGEEIGDLLMIGSTIYPESLESCPCLILTRSRSQLIPMHVFREGAQTVRAALFWGEMGDCREGYPVFCKVMIIRCISPFGAETN